MAKEDVLLQYTQLALEGLGLQAAWELVQSGAPTNMLNQFEQIVAPTLNSVLFDNTDSQYAVLQNAETEFRVDLDPKAEPAHEVENFRRMSAAIIATILGEDRASLGLVHLGALLVVQPLNWKLIISHFLGNISDDRVGITYKEIPSKNQILGWARRIAEQDIHLEPRLKELAQYSNSFRR